MVVSLAAFGLCHEPVCAQPSHTTPVFHRVTVASDNNPRRVEGELRKSNAQEVTIAVGDLSFYAPIRRKGRFEAEVYTRANSSGTKSLQLQLGNSVHGARDVVLPRIDFGALDRDVAQWSLARNSEDIHQVAESCALWARKLREAGYPAMAAQLYKRSWDWRRAELEEVGSLQAWMQWWPRRLAHIQVLLIEGRDQEAVRVFARDLPAFLAAKPPARTLQKWAEQTMALAEFALSMHPSSKRYNLQVARSLAQIAGVFRQRGGLLPRRIDPIWFR